MIKASTAQIGRCGELLVQFRLLKCGIESAAMTTDAGIDLVAYSSGNKRAVTIQVKANEKPKPAGGKGTLALDWWISEASPAELVALVDLQLEQVWLLQHAELMKVAQQRSGGRVHFYMYSDESYSPRKAGTHCRDFKHLLLEERVQWLFFDL